MEAKDLTKSETQSQQAGLSQKWFIATTISVLLTGLITGSVVYFWQSSANENELNSLRQEITILKNQANKVKNIDNSELSPPPVVQPTSSEESNCAKAGERSRAPLRDWEIIECCEGLTEISQGLVYRPDHKDANQDGCLTVVGSGVVCSDCGNGFCEEWENPCNCLTDCQ